jgi:hypothetical protein
MTGATPFAYYDSLAIVSKLASTFTKTAISEVHLFAYLACLLGLYRGKPVADWGYEFVATENGSPFSLEVEEAIQFLIREGYLVESARYLTISSLGQEEYANLQELSQNEAREEFIEASCSCVVAVPLGVIRSAVATDHDMEAARQLQDTRRLLTDSAVADLHDVFKALSEEIGVDIKDLIVPAVVWLKFLSLAETEPPLLATG